MARDPQAQLAEGVKDKSDDEILGLLGGMGGTGPALDAIFDGMAKALNPDAAQDCIIGYEIAEAGKTHAFAVVIRDKAAAIERREPSDARVTLGLSVPDFLRLITGNLDGMQAFMQGKLKLKGDMMFAQQIQRMFSR